MISCTSESFEARALQSVNRADLVDFEGMTSFFASHAEHDSRSEMWGSISADFKWRNDRDGRESEGIAGAMLVISCPEVEGTVRERLHAGHLFRLA